MIPTSGNWKFKPTERREPGDKPCSSRSNIMKQTEEHFINIDSIRSQKYEINSRRCRDNEEPCMICGKGITEAAQVYLVHYTISGQITDLKTDQLPEDESQGYFPIGSDCMKKLPASFITKIKN